MTAAACQRTWQVEAARDGRLSGKDLESALRHREHCAECSREQQRLDQLARELCALPELARDDLAVRRGRQQLMTEVNRSFLREPSPEPKRWLAALALLPAAALGYALFARHAAHEASSVQPQSVIEVHAPADARWQLYRDSSQERIDLSEGDASFRVFPHSGRRVIVRLPDGEIEDMGTVFEVSVRAGHTEHVAVSEGRIAVRFTDQPEFRLSAGEQWQRAARATPSSIAPEPARSPATASAAPLRRAPATTAATSLAKPAASAAAASSGLATDSARAEDAAYLKIVALLRQERYPEARAQAKAYLLRFPNGFRRIEVLNVATSPDPSAP